VTDHEWDVLRPEAEVVMADLRRATGRPMVHSHYERRPAHPEAMVYRATVMIMTRWLLLHSGTGGSHFSIRDCCPGNLECERGGQ
jgi:hypothetical protein